MKITLETIFGELLEEYPDTEAIIKKYMGEDVYCITCPGRMFDTIQNGAMLHGLSEQEILALITELQQEIDKHNIENKGQ